MSESLFHRIDEELQAGEWTADWSPPVPVLPEKHGSTLESHVCLSWEGRFVTFQDPREVFESWCDRCGHPTGPRTKTPLRFAIEDPANLCADFGTAPGKLTIFSETLATALQSIAGDQITFRPAERLGRGRIKYFEPIATAPAALPRPVSAYDKDTGWKCDICGFEYLYHDWKRFAATTFYRRSDLPLNNELLILIDCWGCLELCPTAEWWKSHRRKPYAKGAVGHSIGTLNDDSIDPSPRLRPYSKLWPTPFSHRKKWWEKQGHLAGVLGLDIEPWLP